MPFAAPEELCHAEAPGTRALKEPVVLVPEEQQDPGSFSVMRWHVVSLGTVIGQSHACRPSLRAPGFHTLWLLPLHTSCFKPKSSHRSRARPSAFPSE